MTFRTVVRDGLIVVNTHGKIPDGTPVDVVPSRPGDRASGTGRAKSKQRKSRKGKRVKPLHELRAFGMWKDRPEWKGLSTLEIAALLREKALGRGNGRARRSAEPRRRG